MAEKVAKPNKKAAIKAAKAVEAAKIAPKRAPTKKQAAQRSRKAQEPQQPRRRWDLAFWVVVVIAVVVGLLFVPWSQVGDWVNDTVTGIWDTLGWGIGFIAVAVGAVTGLAKRHRLSSLVRRWNQWLGGITALLAGWALLAVFDLGGSVGASILGAQDAGGYARIGGLFVAALFLIVPELGYHMTVRPVQWLRNRPPRAPRPHREPAPTEPSSYIGPTMASTITALPEPSPRTAEVSATAGQDKPQEPSSQKARDVWDKFVRPAQEVDGWKLPPIDILDRTGEVEFGQADNMHRAKLIEEALASYGVDAKVVQINAGPTVTQFGVEPGWDRKTKQVREKDKDGNVHIRVKETGRTRVKVERINSLSNDLSLALAAPSIRIEAPVPGKPVVGIEVPNVTSTAVNLRGVIETSGFQKILSKSTLALGLGKGAGGEAESSDLARMPHLLIAGATGSGKTVCLNSIICCLLLHNTPNDLRLIMIDPKRVELTPYNTIPHLAIPVIVKTDRALDALRWLNQEMDKRYQQLAKAGARNIDGYNKNKRGQDRLPFLVLVIDELADLMMTGFDEVEHILCRLAQLARAVGIHLVVATKRPSVDVVTGLI
ncbi:MAG: DNA translocase FtsK, partial [Planctomycetota bacterium]